MLIKDLQTNYNGVNLQALAMMRNMMIKVPEHLEIMQCFSWGFSAEGSAFWETLNFICIDNAFGYLPEGYTFPPEAIADLALALEHYPDFVGSAPASEIVTAEMTITYVDNDDILERDGLTEEQIAAFELPKIEEKPKRINGEIKRLFRLPTP